MPYTDFAALGGKPVELYHFATGASEWFWTSAEQTITATIAGVNGGVATDYTPVALLRGRVVSDEEAATQNMEVTVERDNAIAALFAAGAPDALVALTIYGWQRDDVGGGATYPVLFAGQVKSTKVADAQAVLLCGPYQDVLQRKLLPILAQPTCNNTLYRTRCGVDRAAHTHAGTVKALDPTRTIVQLDDVLAAVFAGDVGTYGRARLAGGKLTVGSEERTIIAYDPASGRATLLQALRAASANDALSAEEGCDKLHDTCFLQFANLANHQGYRDVPTRNPFDGSVV